MSDGRSIVCAVSGCACPSDEHYFEVHELLPRDADPISMALSPDSGSENGLPSLDNLPPEIASAVQSYWETRSGQAEEQRASSNTARGRRAEVLGGGQMDGFAGLVEDLLVAEAVPRESVKHDYHATLPGFFRHEKEWDTAVVYEGKLLAALEYKSQGSSFGNNLNNRAEEAIGSNTDLLEAYEEGVFAPSPQPFVGYLMLMADNERSREPVGLREPNFEADDEFQGASYARRAELLCLRMVRKRLVSGAAFLMSGQEEGLEGGYSEPNEELRFERFARELHLTRRGARGLRVSPPGPKGRPFYRPPIHTEPLHREPRLA